MSGTYIDVWKRQISKRRDGKVISIVQRGELEKNNYRPVENVINFVVAFINRRTEYKKTKTMTRGANELQTDSR